MTYTKLWVDIVVQLEGKVRFFSRHLSTFYRLLEEKAKVVERISHFPVTHKHFRWFGNISQNDKIICIAF